MFPSLLDVLSKIYNILKRVSLFQNYLKEKFCFVFSLNADSLSWLSLLSFNFFLFSFDLIVFVKCLSFRLSYLQR
jgi:hypothetical protein